MIRIALLFVIIAIGCVVVGLVITKIISMIAKMNKDFDNRGDEKNE